MVADEPSRGVYVKNAARFIVPEGRVFDVREPVTFEGTLTKLGGGTLVLLGVGELFEGLDFFLIFVGHGSICPENELTLQNDSNNIAHPARKINSKTAEGERFFAI